jgi:hypothetical protein
MYEMMNFFWVLLLIREVADSCADTVGPSARLHITIRYAEY